MSSPSAAPLPTSSRRVPRTRAGMAWVAACTAGIIAIALIIFMLQNTSPVQVSFLWLTATTSLSLMLLIAAVGGSVVALILGSARIVQLRHTIHRRRPVAPTAPSAYTASQPDGAHCRTT